MSVDATVSVSVACSPCPYATWTLWCPYSGTPVCMNCPVYLHREQDTATYTFPRDTDMKTEPSYTSFWIECTAGQ